MTVSGLSIARGGPLDGAPPPLVDLLEIRSGGPPPDGIPSIDEPTFLSAAEVDFLAENEPVLAIDIDGDARAYPVQILMRHEIVNDTVGGIPVAITYCPLCNSTVAYDRRVDERTLGFGTSGLLWNSALRSPGGTRGDNERKHDLHGHAPRAELAGRRGCRGSSASAIRSVQTAFAAAARRTAAARGPDGRPHSPLTRSAEHLRHGRNPSRRSAGSVSGRHITGVPHPTHWRIIMHQVCSTLTRFRPAAPLVLRVVLGGLFIWHGIDKFDTGISMIEDMFAMWGVPVPGLTAPLTAVIEIVAGAALVLGIGTRIAAMLLSVVLIGALIYVKRDLGIISSQPMPGAELDLALLAGLVSVIVLGPGRISLDHHFGIEPDEASAQREPAYAA